MLALRLPPEIERRLEALAAKTGRSKSYYAREAILEHLGELEDGYLARERLLAGGRTVTLEELEAEFAAELEDEGSTKVAGRTQQRGGAGPKKTRIRRSKTGSALPRRTNPAGGMKNPRRLGHALTGDLAGLWSYRVGDLRVVAAIEDRLIRILVLRIGHRREIYR